ncbi:MAG: sialate O-acetylesterase [Lentisphaeria bacterium]|nr:sialate O-acetylesterase [Lentisphaeria bacterium]
MKKRHVCLSIVTVCLFTGVLNCAAQTKPIKVFILAGDEMVLEQAPVSGRTEGTHEDFYPNAEATKDEKRKHVNVAVYKGAYSPRADYDALKPDVTGIVEIGEQRTRQIHPKKRGREPVPYTPFPELARQDGYTTVLRGYLSVNVSGKYECHPGQGESAFNVTTVEGKEVYRREVDQKTATITRIQLDPKKRYAFQTIFFKKPGHDFHLPLVNKPGTLESAVAENPKYGGLKDKDGQWVTRDDVFLYDAHSIHNNTEAPARPLRVGTMVRNGPEVGVRMGVELMLGHRLGDAFEEPVMLLRFGTKHPTWFHRGSRDLAHDYRPPSSGGGSDLDGSWDVIHFNHGVWDATYRDPSSKYYSGYRTTSVEDFEKNLRTLVAKMKKTGATIIWGSVTPVWEGEPGRLNGDEDAYNRVAEKVMKENGVIINDLNAEVRRQGAGKSKNVHDVGNLAPKVTETIQDALANRKTLTKPLPRVLFIGDSITGTYWGQVAKNLEGKAVVFKNPGNAEDTWNGLERIDQWLDLSRYLLNGQEYLELVDGVKKVLGPELERAFPGYAGQGTELAGFIWFQGIADTGSDVKAAEYEKHLANLIRDVRNDLNAPKLPVVVVALANSKEPMRPNQQKVFDAQMAVGDKETYPEFAGNVISIDTRPMCKPAAQSPGGRDPYAGNAETYLEIGEAMGRAMLKMME